MVNSRGPYSICGTLLSKNITAIVSPFISPLKYKPIVDIPESKLVGSISIKTPEFTAGPIHPKY
jgi:hypothetical protein